MAGRLAGQSRRAVMAWAAQRLGPARLEGAYAWRSVLDTGTIVANGTDAPVERVTHLLSHESPAIFVVMGNGKYEILTKYDLMGTIAGLMELKR